MRAKPVAGAQVDWGHPLARGLKNCVVLGGSPYDATQKPVTLLNGGTVLPRNDPSATRFTGTVSGSTPEQVSVDPGWGGATKSVVPYTVDAMVRITAATKGVICGFAAADYNTNASAAHMQGFGIGGSGTLDSVGTTFIGLNDNISWLDTGDAVPLNQWVHLAMTLDRLDAGATFLFYMNGRRVHSQGSDPGITAAAGAMRLFVGGNYKASGSIARVFTGDIATVRHWSRVLSAAELARLAEDPYGILARQSPRRIYYIPFSQTITGTGAGSATSSGTAAGTVTSPAAEQERFGGGPISVRDLDRMKQDEQLVRLLREDEEVLCLI